jgi:predicted N-acetyltransferase YhbS
MNSLAPTLHSRLRPLAPRDLESVIRIDASLRGRMRGAYFERRLAAAGRDPERHLQLALEDNGRLAGYMLGRALEGEFGRTEPALRLEAFGVAAGAQGRGLGAALERAFEDEARRRGLNQIRTTALWRERALLGFFDRAGFRLAPVHVLDCALAETELGSPREAPVEPGAQPADPNDYGTPRSGDFEPLARDRIELATLSEADLEGVARIDRRHTGRDRRGYLCRSLREALADGVRVSLAARLDGAVAGYVMARLDYGDFGRAEPVALIDTIGVDPLRARQGIGRALLSQLFANLAAIGVERVETAVAPGDLGLMGFFYRAGFRPSERLAFLKQL